MSCGTAAVPRLTSVGRELLILSRVLTQTFWLRYPNLLLQLPRSSTLSQSWISCFLDTETSFWSTLCQYGKCMSFLWQKLHYMIAHIHTGRGWSRSALGGNSGGKTRTAVFAQLHLGYFDSLEVPCALPLSAAKWCICPICVPSNCSRLFYQTLQRTKGWALNYLWFFLAHSLGNNSEHRNQETHSADGLCQTGPAFWTTEIKTRWKYTHAFNIHKPLVMKKNNITKSH